LRNNCVVIKNEGISVIYKLCLIYLDGAIVMAKCSGMPINAYLG